MRLWANSVSTNPRRVLIYLAEKGIALERVDVDIAPGAPRDADFLRLSPAGKIPVLELDDGTALIESAAIVEYLEELHPDPPMIGVEPAARARVRADERIVSDLIAWTGVLARHASPLFKDRVDQQPAAAEAARPLVAGQLDMLERRMGDHAFLSGDKPSIADCSLCALLQVCRDRLALPLVAGHPGLQAWFERFDKRPSARA